MFNQYPGLDERIAADRDRLHQENPGRIILATYKVREMGRFAFYLMDAEGKLQSWKQASLARPSQIKDEPAPPPYRDVLSAEESLSQFAAENGWVKSVDEVLRIWIWASIQAPQ